MTRIFLLFFVTICLSLNAQNKKVYVEYKTVKAISEMQRKLDPELKKGLEIYVNAIENIEFELFANDSISIFRKKEKLKSENQNPLSSILNNGIYYTNIKAKEKIKSIDMSGEKFNITYVYSEYKWTITQETKIINGFKCYKATTNREIYSKTRNKNIITNPKVWFTPEIPLSYGPFGLIGLPGLILEATINGKLYYYATKVNLDYKEKPSVKLEKPTKGKFVTESEMEDIQIKTFSGN